MFFKFSTELPCSSSSSSSSSSSLLPVEKPYLNNHKTNKHENFHVYTYLFLGV